MRFIAIYLLMLLLTACNLDLSAPGAARVAPTERVESVAAGQLIVAWAEAGNLVIWREGEDLPRRVASSGVIRPYISPDGAAVLFTRGVNGIPESLWVVDSEGRAEQQLVASASPRNVPQSLQIGDVAWLDDTIFYFNTLEPGLPAPVPRNDLYRASIQTREVARILAPGDGGRFQISPDKQWVAVTSPGTYGNQDGRIRLLDPLKLRDPRDLLFFVGVATGGHHEFYPELKWLPDSSAIRVAIPDADLIFSETAEDDSVPPTRLWHLPIDNPSDRDLTGSIESSFFGLPQWSPDGSQFLYARRTPGSNTFEILLADKNGETIVTVSSGQAGDIAVPRWLPTAPDFFYRDEALFYLNNAAGTSRLLSTELLFNPKFVSDTQFVFGTVPATTGEGIEMRYGNIDGTSQSIGAAGDLIPVFDARLLDK
ncbi:MAG: TolB family protein [Aggregatilineales bacterium]